MSKRPNILFLFTDQHSKSSLGCYGNDICKTPTFDSLAARGVSFDNAYTTCAICTPARASVQTGLYPNRHGMQTNIFQHGCMIHELADRPQLLSRRLVEYGYSAGYTGKWHLGYGKEAFEDPYYNSHIHEIDLHRDDIEYPDFYREGSSLPTDLGYEGDDFPGHGGGGHAYPQYKQYLEENGLKHEIIKRGQGFAEVTSPVESTMAYYLTERARHHIGNFIGRDKPWFMMLNFWGPHGPTYVPTKYLEPYRNASIPPWPNFNDPLINKPRIHNSKRNRKAGWEHYEDHLRYYYGFVSFIDAQIARLLAWLEENDQLDNTWIIFSADHGDSMGIHAGLGDKAMYMYEETTSIPLIIVPPKGRNGRREARFANTTDIYSTILDIAGVPAEKNRRDGRSLLPLMSGEDVPDWPETVVTEGSGIAHCLFSQRMIRKGNIKYVFNCGDIDELYDLDADPHELHNLAPEESSFELLREMRRELEAWIKQHKDGILQSFHMIVPKEER